MAMQIKGNIYELPVVIEKYIRDLEEKAVAFEARIKELEAAIGTGIREVIKEVESSATTIEKEIAADVQRTLNEAAEDKDKFVAWVKEGVAKLEAEGGKVEHFFQHLFEKK